MHLGDWSGLQAIQIHAAGDMRAAMVTAIPMGGMGTRQILTRRSIAQVDFSDQGPPDIVDTQAHLGGGVELIGDIGVWVEGIGEVSQQRRLRWQRRRRLNCRWCRGGDVGRHIP